MHPTKYLVALLLLYLGFVEQSHGQIKNFLFDHFKQEKTVTYGLNNRRTQMLSEPSSIYAGYVGIKFGSQLKHVVTLNSTVLFVGDYEQAQTSEPLQIQLNYVGLAEEFKFWQHNRWSLSSYIHFGIGQGRFRSTTPTAPQWLYPVETGIHWAYSLNDWLEIRGGAGYRHVFRSADLPLHGNYYKLGAGLNLKEFRVWSKENCASHSSI